MKPKINVTVLEPTGFERNPYLVGNIVFEEKNNYGKLWPYFGYHGVMKMIFKSP